MTRSSSRAPVVGLAAAGAALIATAYGFVRLAYGLLLPDVRADLGLGAAAAGWIAAGSSASYCVGALAGLVGAARPRLLVVIAMLVGGLGAAGMAASTAPSVFGASAVLASACAGLASPALVGIVGRSVPARSAGRVQTAVNAGTGPGLVAAGVLALVLLPDWRTVWVVASIASVVTGAAVLLLAAPGGVEARRSAPLSRRRGERRHRVLAVLPSGGWVLAHRRPLLASALLGAGSAAVWTFGRSALVEAGASTAVSTGAWIALGIGGVAVIAALPLTDALTPRTSWTITAVAVAAATVVVAVAPGATVVVLVACVVFGWGYTAATGALIAWTTGIDPSRAPVGTSVLFVVLVLGQAIGAAAAGSVAAAAGLGAAFLLAAAAAALSALVAAVGPRSRAGAVRDGEAVARSSEIPTSRSVTDE